MRAEYLVFEGLTNRCTFKLYIFYYFCIQYVSKFYLNKKRSKTKNVTSKTGLTCQIYIARIYIVGKASSLFLRVQNTENYFQM